MNLLQELLTKSGKSEENRKGKRDGVPALKNRGPGSSAVAEHTSEPGGARSHGRARNHVGAHAHGRPRSPWRRRRCPWSGEAVWPGALASAHTQASGGQARWL